ncbi:MAG: YceI family protein [Bdellovibrionota bacterium]
MNFKKSLTLFVLLSVFPMLGHASTYVIDHDHSNVNFKIRHFIGKVNGSFQDFQGTIEYDEAKPKNMKVEGKITVSSINTGVDKRDEHLKSPDFFDIANKANPGFQNITFKSTKVKQIETKGEVTKALLVGDLTIHGVTKPVELNIELDGPAKDPFGNVKISIEAEGEISRKDFGLTWNKALETGGVLVGEEVEMELNIQAVAQKEEKKK